MRTGKLCTSMNPLARVEASSLQQAACCLMVAVILASSTSASDKTLMEDMKYRKDRIAWMRSERSPLALAGLFWLRPGKNNFGTDQSNDFVLPVGSAPGRVGYFELKENSVGVDVGIGTLVKLNGKASVDGQN